MTIVTAKIDLNSIGMTLSQWESFIGSNQWQVFTPPPELDLYTQRDFLHDWIDAGTISNFTEATADSSLWCPGVYALVLDPVGDIKNPILTNRTIVFGESTQDAAKRIVTHAIALRGKISNGTEKWNKAKKVVCAHFGLDKLNNDHIRILFRPHKLSDPTVWQYDREFSSTMETQAQALYQILWGYRAPANTRDLPNMVQLEHAEKFLVERNYKCKINLSRLI